MILFPVLDILAEDWIRTRRESARTYGTKPSRLPDPVAAARRLFSSKSASEAPVTVVAPRNRTA